MATTVIYYTTANGQNPVQDFIRSLQKSQQAKVRRIFVLAETYGLNSIQPYVKKLTGSPLWEIRIVGKDNIRILYVAPSGDTVIALHGFIKKSQKTPAKDISTALKRLNTWKVANCK